jgi:hypothetical protein
VVVFGEELHMSRAAADEHMLGVQIAVEAVCCQTSFPVSSTTLSSPSAAMAVVREASSTARVMSTQTGTTNVRDCLRARNYQLT